VERIVLNCDVDYAGSVLTCRPRSFQLTLPLLLLSLICTPSVLFIQFPFTVLQDLCTIMIPISALEQISAYYLGYNPHFRAAILLFRSFTFLLIDLFGPDIHAHGLYRASSRFLSLLLHPTNFLVLQHKTQKCRSK
jgi:hypothetical protein